MKNNNVNIVGFLFVNHALKIKIASVKDIYNIYGSSENSYVQGYQILLYLLYKLLASCLCASTASPFRLLPLYVEVRTMYKSVMPEARLPRGLTHLSFLQTP